MADTRRPTGIRLWPAVAIAVLGAAALLWVWVWMEGIRQDRFVRSYAVGFGVLAALLLWMLLLSRLRWRTRALALAAAAGLGALAAAVVEIRGVTGDLVPILSFRWAGEEPPALAEPEAPAIAVAADAAGYPQFLGPNRDGTVGGVRLARDWERRPPELVWRRPVGTGWAGFAVAGGQAITLEQHGDEELVVSYELATGRPQWAHADRTRYATTVGGEGPRSVPTIAGDRVFTMGGTGLLNALDRRTGRRRWGRDVPAENGAGIPEWGKSCSPLVHDGLVVVSAGGGDGRSLVAYDAATGELAWRGGDDASGYASPLAATLAGVPQIVIFNAASVAAHHPADGRVLWSFPWPRDQPNVSNPLHLPGDRLFVSSGYGIGAKLLAVTGDGAAGLAAELLWESPRLKAKFTNVVHHRGYLYGLDDGVLVCLDPATGERCWKRGRYGHGQVILAGDLLLVQAENGAVALVEPDPDGHRELARFQALDGKTWNPPALAGDLLLVRNHREAALYRLPLEG